MYVIKWYRLCQELKVKAQNFIVLLTEAMYVIKSIEVKVTVQDIIVLVTDAIYEKWYINSPMRSMSWHKT